MWQILPEEQPPESLRQAIKPYLTQSDGHFTAQLLWQRGIREPQQIVAFLDPDHYQPSSPFAFGQEMKCATQRIFKARETLEKVTIWGDFDTDGITATSLLWEGLGQFLTPHLQLDYYIPNRLTESHGLNIAGIDKLAQQGTQLIITCDTGSTNLTEIAHANTLGIDIIITDHHSLPEDRPPVISILNPRYFVETHPIYHLSGVAMAYKLVEGLYLTYPEIPTQPLENLLDLVGIGLIADLVQLVGDSRYLAQKGIQQLQKNQRLGVKSLLNLCRKTGDRPMDISFGLAPRINAVSRIYGDGSFCVELLTSKDERRCQELAKKAEEANSRRKLLQTRITQQVKKKLIYLDLSTTSVIVLEDTSWDAGILGLVASQIAQEYNRPTVLLQTDLESNLARGSARSINQIDLYELVLSQQHLLTRFGGHPFAAGLSLPLENLPQFKRAINQQAKLNNINLTPSPIKADLVLEVKDLSPATFKELKLIEPSGIGNTSPKLFLTKCWFTNIISANIKDYKTQQINYYKTKFDLVDDTCRRGFPGIWWGHKPEDIPRLQLCDVIVELDYNSNNQEETNYHVRLIALRPSPSPEQDYLDLKDLIVDWRQQDTPENLTSDCRLIKQCPRNWDEIFKEFQQAIAQKQKLALAYDLPSPATAQQLWIQLIGIAKYLSRTQQKTTKDRLKQKLSMGDRILSLGLEMLEKIGFQVTTGEHHDLTFTITSDGRDVTQEELTKQTRRFIEAVGEDQFQQQYFAQVPLEVIQANVSSISAYGNN